MGTAVALVLTALIIEWFGMRLFRRGWYGRFVGDRPFCRRCGFDLSNRELIGHCPECGVDIEARREVVVGVRRHRWIVVAIGSVIMLISAVPLGVVVTGAHQNFEGQRYKPAFWLLHEATAGDQGEQALALAELKRRLALRQLSASTITGIIDRGLYIQRDTRRSWNTAWGDWIEAARDWKFVSDEQWKRYAQQAVTTQWLTFITRPRAHQNDTVTARLEGGKARVGRTPRFMVELRELGLVVDQKEYPPGNSGKNMKAMSLDALNGGVSVSGGVDGMNTALSMLGLGEHKGHFRVQATVTEVTNPQGVAINRPPSRVANINGASVSPFTPLRRQGQVQMSIDPRTVQRLQQAGNDTRAIQAILAARMAQFRADEAAQAEARAVAEELDSATAVAQAGNPTGADVELHLPVKFEVVDSGATVAAGVKDESLRPRVQRAIGVYMVNRSKETQAEVQVQCDNPPMDLSYKVYLREGEQEWPIGNLLLRAHQTTMPPVLIGSFPPDQGPTGSTVDVVFRPDGTASELGTQGVEKYWDGAITVSDVPVNDPGGATRRRQRDAAAMAAMQRYSQMMDDAQTAIAATRPATRSAIASPPSPELDESFAKLHSMQLELREKLLAVPADDTARYQTFLKLADTGLIKLLQRGKYPETMLGLRGGGACYSFVSNSREEGYASDLELNDGRLCCGSMAESYGYFLPLGDVWIEDLAGSNSSTPKWARGQVAAQWSAMWRATPMDASVVRGTEAIAIQRSNGRTRPGVSAEPGRSYLLRSVSNAADLLVALQVVRKFDDGSVVLAYRIMKRFDRPIVK